jgi:hypothetical protein
MVEPSTESAEALAVTLQLLTGRVPSSYAQFFRQTRKSAVSLPPLALDRRAPASLATPKRQRRT